MSIITDLPIEQFETIVKNSKCYADICRHLGLRRQGGFYRTIQRRIKKYNISINHFLSVSDLLSKKSNFNWINKEDFLIRLNNGENICEDTLKKKIIEFNLIPHQCFECSLKHIWNNKLLVLQLDHKDGNHKNNQLLNLRWLCPNCHSQTETYCGKHKKKVVYKCQCGKLVSKKQTICKSCSAKKQSFKNRKPHVSGIFIPLKEELQILLNISSFCEIGRRYNVSDNAVRKWCKKYNLPHRKKDMVGDAGIEPAKEVCNTSSLPLA